MPQDFYSTTPGSGLKIAAESYTDSGNTLYVPIISNKVVTSIGTNTGGIGTTSYAVNQLMGTSQFTFSDVALKAGLGGVIQNASLYCEVVSTGQYLLRLFSKPITTVLVDRTNYASYALTDVEAQTFIGDIEFSFPLASSLNTTYSVNGISMAFSTDDAGSPAIYGLLLARNAHSLPSITGQGIKINLNVLL